MGRENMVVEEERISRDKGESMKNERREKVRNKQMVERREMLKHRKISDAGRQCAFCSSCEDKHWSEPGTVLYRCKWKGFNIWALKRWFHVETSTGLSRMLLSSPNCPVLDALGKNISFETAFGLNGRVWVNAAAPRTVIILTNVIMNSETLSETQQRIMVEKLLEKISD